MKKSLSVCLCVAALLSVTFIGCRKKQPARTNATENPFTLDYKVSDDNARFFLQGDSTRMLVASSPFYAGAHPLPGQNTEEFDKARATKVQEIIDSADKCAEISSRISPSIDNMRSAYLDYLSVCYKADRSIKPFVKAGMAQIVSVKSNSTKARACYEGFVLPSGNDFARTSLQYMRTLKAMDYSTLTLQDVNNIVGQAATVEKHFENSSNAQVKEYAAILDIAMQGLDKIADDLQTISDGLNQTRYGLRQLETADHYFALAALAFMKSELPAVKEKLVNVNPTKQISAKDVQLLKAYTGYLEKFSTDVEKRLNAVDKKRLVQREPSPQRLVAVAWARSDEGYYGEGLSSLKNTMQGEQKTLPTVA